LASQDATDMTKTRPHKKVGYHTVCMETGLNLTVRYLSPTLVGPSTTLSTSLSTSPNTGPILTLIIFVSTLQCRQSLLRL